MRATECCARIVVVEKGADGRKRRRVLDETCGKPLPPRRRRFCSDDCARRQERVERITETSAYTRSLSRQIANVGVRAAGDLDALRWLSDEITRAKRTLTLAVEGARAFGYSDHDIATALGVTQQAITKRYPRDGVTLYAKQRAIVFAHYGERCVCCGSADQLTLDHVNGDGKTHRREIGHWRSQFYAYLIREGLPAGYQTLCTRCNTSKGQGAQCRLDHAGDSQPFAVTERPIS